MVWWLWALGGLALLAVELLTPGGFFFLFFGLGALGTAVLVGLRVLEEPWAQWLAFSAGSVAALLAFRQRLRAPLEADAPAVGSLVGEIGRLEDALAPGEVGRLELRGTSWSARHEGASALARGQRCRVLRVEGLMLWIAPEEPGTGGTHA